MPLPRYRGYGFRNVGGWEVRDNCAKAGRNLNIASSGVLLYLISGARVEGLSFAGVSLVAKYPSAFLIFGLAIFAWLGYRFLLAYRDAADADPWWHLYMRDIVLQRYPISAYVSAELRRMFAPPRTSFSMSHTTAVRDFRLCSATLVAPEVILNKTVVGTDVELVIPRKELMRAHLYCFPRYLISNSDIADMWVPWLLYVLAIAAIVLEWTDASPAGIFGLLPARTS